MRKFLLSTLLVVLLSVGFGQTVIVVDPITRLGIPGVRVYAKGEIDTLETNFQGEVNLDLFSADKPILFYHPLYETVILKKKQIERNDWIVVLPRGPKLLANKYSLLQAKEYSYGLPFYVKILNLDYSEDFPEDQGAIEKLMFNTDERGVTVFRGIEPNKVLLALDGLRLNNAIYKNGRIERAINFERTILQNVQRIFDPTFLIYGPDGLGGVLHYFTKFPVLSKTFYPLLHLSTTHRYESASSSWLSNYQTSFSTHKFSWLNSVTYIRQGDIVAGRNRKFVPMQDSLYGLHLYRVVRVGEEDTVVLNPDPFVQLGTNYRQLYILEKFRFKLQPGLFLLSNFYITHTSSQDIYSGLTEMNGEHPRFAECKYLPTLKLINSNVLYIRRSTRWFDFASLMLANQYIEEYRLTRKFKNPVQLHQIEHLYVTNVNADFVKIYNLARLAYGALFTFNSLHSKAFFRNILTDSVWPGLTRYPTNGAGSLWTAFYAHYRNMYFSRLFIDVAFRMDMHKLWAKFSPTAPQLPLPFDRIDTIYLTPSFSVSLDAYPVPGVQSRLTFSRSAHIPILDEMAKVMFKDFVVVIPTRRLLPESSYYLELSNTLTLSKYVRFQFAGFNSYTHNFILLVDTTLNGLDSLSLGKDKYEIATRTNLKKVDIYGLSLSFKLHLPLNVKRKFYLKLSSVFNLSKAKNLTNSLPVPNVSPYFGSNTLLLNFQNYTFQVAHIYSGPKPINELSPVGEDYIEKASKFGFLPWSIVNLSMKGKFKHLNFSVGINNVFDVFYRPYASSINGSGRSYVFTVEILF